MPRRRTSNRTPALHRPGGEPRHRRRPGAGHRPPARRCMGMLGMSGLADPDNVLHLITATLSRYFGSWQPGPPTGRPPARPG